MGTAMSNFGGSTILSPLTAFGELAVAESTPIIQITGVYDNLGQVDIIAAGAGSSAGKTTPFFTCTCGADAGSFASILSKRQLSYRAGQGLSSKFTALYGSPATGNSQLAGLISGTDRMGFGYNDDQEFGIHHWYHGVLGIEELLITTTGTGNVSISVDGTPYWVNLAGGTVEENAQEIAVSLNSQTPLHTFASTGATVVLRSLLAGTHPSSTYDPLASGSVAAWTPISTGADPTKVWIPQSSWNLDTKDDLDPQKGNVFDITMQYLGFGAITFSVEDSETGRFLPVHRIKWANQNTTTSSSNPTFRLGWVTGNEGAGAVNTLKGASAAGFIQGKLIRLSPARSKTQVGPATTVETNILSMRNRSVFGTLRNRVEMFGKSLSLASESTKTTVFRVYKGAIVAGPNDWQYVDKTESTMEYMVDGGLVSGGELRGAVQVATLDTALIQLQDIIPILLPDETLTVTAEVSSGAGADVGIAFNWQEDLT
jgi:hypothetical protein